MTPEREAELRTHVNENRAQYAWGRADELIEALDAVAALRQDVLQLRVENEEILQALAVDRAIRNDAIKRAEKTEVQLDRPKKEQPQEPKAQCELCDESDILQLRAKCHLTAPLKVELIDQRTLLQTARLVLRCYVPDCSREVARFNIQEDNA